jgi:hypothetical protein
VQPRELELELALPAAAGAFGAIAAIAVAAENAPTSAIAAEFRQNFIYFLLEDFGITFVVS